MYYKDKKYSKGDSEIEEISKRFFMDFKNVFDHGV